MNDYPYVAMDTEFPGTVVKPIGNFVIKNDENYHSIKANVELTKLIQVGLTFFDEMGKLPTCGTDKFCIWQFNLREFNMNEDIHFLVSIELLSENGIDFNKNNEKGVNAFKFTKLLVSSGVMLNRGVYWIAFHGGIDFGYLLKLLTGKNLPNTQELFLQMLRDYFPKIYDINHLIKLSNSLHGGLEKVAKMLGVKRIGTAHQAGSDSLLTCCTFMKLKEMISADLLEQHAGVLHRLGEKG